MTDDIKWKEVTRDVLSDLNESDARILIGVYYSIQRERISINNKAKAAQRAGRSGMVFRFILAQLEQIEYQIMTLLKKFVAQDEAASWAMSQHGVGPVTAAALAAYVDMDVARCASSVWSYAGLSPGQRRQKGQKTNFNVRLKMVMWNLGESFVRNHKSDKCYYGHIFSERKEYETIKNERGDYADQAAEILKTRTFNNDDDNTVRQAYEAGKLPLSHIHERSKRYAVKLFLAHYFEVAYRIHHGEDPPNPYAIEYLGHVHRIPVPEKNDETAEPSLQI